MGVVIVVKPGGLPVLACRLSEAQCKQSVNHLPGGQCRPWPRCEGAKTEKNQAEPANISID